MQIQSWCIVIHLLTIFLSINTIMMEKKLYIYLEWDFKINVELSIARQAHNF